MVARGGFEARGAGGAVAQPAVAVAGPDDAEAAFLLAPEARAVLYAVLHCGGFERVLRICKVVSWSDVGLRSRGVPLNGLF